MRPLDLGGDPRDLRAAVDLAARHQVLFRAERGSAVAVALEQSGFVPLADELHCLHHLTGDRLGRLDRRRRKAVREQLGSWCELGIEVLVTTAKDLGEDAIVREFYYPLLVPRLYARGESPFGTHNEAQFRQLSRGALLVTAHLNGQPAGFAAFKPKDLTQLAGTRLPTEDRCRSAVGLVYALDAQLKHFSRAWIFTLGTALAAAGLRVMSMGADTPWIDSGYVPVILDKLGWTDDIGWSGRNTVSYAALAAPDRAERKDTAGLAVIHSTNSAANIEVMNMEMPSEIAHQFRARLMAQVASKEEILA